MSTVNQLRPDDNTQDDIRGNYPEVVDGPSGEAPDGLSGAGTQDIFDVRFQVFMDTFGEVCEREGVSTAIAIVRDPKIQRGPLIFTRGTDYDVARLLAMVLRRLKAQIAQELDT